MSAEVPAIPALIPAPGSPAPDFTLPLDNGEMLTLSSLRGKPVVLFFYPRDDTSSCTAEACEFRDWVAVFDDIGAVIVGVSPDSVKSHVRFRARYELPFVLVADTEKIACRAYGVWTEKSMYGRTYMGVERTTFVIGADGVIVSVIRKVRAVEHAAHAMEAVAAL